MNTDEKFWNRHRLAQTLTAIFALWTLAALITLAMGWRESAPGRAAAGWAAVEGRVTALEVVRVERRGRVPFTVPAVRVAYAYTYGDRAYTGDRLRVDGDPVGPESADGRAWLALTPGATVTVYVNPSDPAQAALDRAPAGRWLPNGLALLGLAALAGVLALWARPARSPAL